MDTVRNFILASIGTLGFLTLTESFEPIAETEDPLELLLKTLLSLMAGLLTALLSRTWRKLVHYRDDKQKSKKKNQSIKKHNHGKIR